MSQEEQQSQLPDEINMITEMQQSKTSNTIDI